jgi:DNA-binding HxlR family transcriptional regulator
MEKHTISDNQVEKNLHSDKDFCPVQATLGIFSGKWKMLLLWNLRHGAKRFGELGRDISGITPAMLTNHLRELEEDGIVARHTWPEVPPRVEYRLTPAGESLIPVIATMEKWAIDYYRRHKGQEISGCVWS